MSAPGPAQLHTAALTDVGRVRSSNQDAWGEFEDADGLRLLVVADGMGGHRGGEAASRIAVETIGSVFRRTGDGAEQRLRQAFEEANQEVHRRAQEEPSLAGMGTTGVALLLDGGAGAFVAHVGDSRAYRLRAGRLERLTADHSLVAELQRRGLLSEEEAATHPRRNEILRSLGIASDVEVDVAALDVEAGDRFLLCSDGLCGVVPEPEIAQVLAGSEPPEAARRLVELANAHGGPDNVTVAIAWLEGAAAAAVPTAAPRPRARARGRRGIRRVLVLAIVVAGLLAALLLLGLAVGLARGEEARPAATSPERG